MSEQLTLRKNDALFTSARTGDISKDEWGTPKPLFDQLQEVHDFTLDAAASTENALCPRFFTIEDNSLSKDWDGRVWCNPPYSRLLEFGAKAWYEIRSNPQCEKIMFLCPARTDTRFFHDYVYWKSDVRFLKGRLTFWVNGAPYTVKDKKGKLVKGTAPFPSMLVLWTKKFLKENDIPHVN